MWNKRTTTISKIKLRNIYLICTTVHNVGDNNIYYGYNIYVCKNKISL